MSIQVVPIEDILNGLHAVPSNCRYFWNLTSGHGKLGYGSSTKVVESTVLDPHDISRAIPKHLTETVWCRPGPTIRVQNDMPLGAFIGAKTDNTNLSFEIVHEHLERSLDGDLNDLRRGAVAILVLDNRQLRPVVADPCE